VWFHKELGIPWISAAIDGVRPVVELKIPQDTGASGIDRLDSPLTVKKSVELVT